MSKFLKFWSVSNIKLLYDLDYSAQVLWSTCVICLCVYVLELAPGHF